MIRGLLLLVGCVVAAGLVVAFARGERRAALPRVAGDGFPRRLEWADGRVLELAAPPVRVLPANAGIVDFLSVLVAPERVVAVPEQAATWSRLAAGAAWRVEPTFRVLDLELVASLAPDLVVTSEFNQGLRGGERLAVLDLPVPASLADVRDQLALLGAVLGTEPEAAAVLADLDRRTDALRASAAALRGLRALIYTNLAGGWSAGGGTLQHEAIALCGMRNLCAEQGGRGNVRITLEEIVGLDPDVLIVPARFGEEDGGTVRTLRSEPVLRELRAVREGMVVELHPRLLSCTSQEVWTAAEELAAAVDARLAARER